MLLLGQNQRVRLTLINFFIGKVCKSKLGIYLCASLLRNGPFVYRLGPQIFILVRGVRLPYGLPKWANRIYFWFALFFGRKGFEIELIRCKIKFTLSA